MSGSLESGRQVTTEDKPEIRGNQATSFSGEPVGDKLSPARPRMCVAGRLGSGHDSGAPSLRSGLADKRPSKLLLCVSSWVETFPFPDIGASPVGPHQDGDVGLGWGGGSFLAPALVTL